MNHIEANLKTFYKGVRSRVRNPKGGIVESKIVRPKEESLSLPKPKREEIHSKIDSATLEQIREDYESGLPMERICEKHHVGSRTVRALRQRHGWPVRERIKPRGKG